MMFIFWALIGYVVYLAVKGNDTFVVGSKSSAESTLKNRYAKGEIDDETYLRMLRQLRG